MDFSTCSWRDVVLNSRDTRFDTRRLELAIHAPHRVDDCIGVIFGAQRVRDLAPDLIDKSLNRFDPIPQTGELRFDRVPVALDVRVDRVQDLFERRDIFAALERGHNTALFVGENPFHTARDLGAIDTDSVGRFLDRCYFFDRCFLNGYFFNRCFLNGCFLNFGSGGFAGAAETRKQIINGVAGTKLFV